MLSVSLDSICKRREGIALALVVAATSACYQAPENECEADVDCPQGDVCDAGKCAPVSGDDEAKTDDPGTAAGGGEDTGEPAECTVDCGGGMCCDEGWVCAPDERCCPEASPYYCGGDTCAPSAEACPDASPWSGPCLVDGDCPEDESCIGLNDGSATVCAPRCPGGDTDCPPSPAASASPACVEIDEGLDVCVLLCSVAAPGCPTGTTCSEITEGTGVCVWS
jgi:hypothetical protein